MNRADPYLRVGTKHQYADSELTLIADISGRDRYGRLRAEVTAATGDGAFLNRKVLDLLNERECRQFAEDCTAVNGEIHYKIPLQYLTGRIAAAFDAEADADVEVDDPSTPAGRATFPSMGPASELWREQLDVTRSGPRPNIANLSLILANHPTWHGRLWWDALRACAMLDEAPLTDDGVIDTGIWLGVHEHLSLTNWKLLERCMITEARRTPRDLLQQWLHALPPWDGTPRLREWLCDAAEVERSAYGMAVSRLLPLSMVARALDPGCLYRYVVILEGPENTGKSALVRTLASPEWFTELMLGLDSKESHMMLQGVWLAEMPELDSLSRTEETRLKAFITLRDDSYIPKYSNNRIVIPRRTVFVGTTNETTYLKGNTGNTRFLPVRTGHIDLSILQQARDQLFAEALQEYMRAPTAWWMLDAPAVEEARSERDKRRLVNIYESELALWLAHPTQRDREEFTWRELAEGFLRLDAPERWKDTNLQKQMAQALRTCGLDQRVVWREGKTTRLWQRVHEEV
jgi:hypothetical protein